MHFFNPVPVMQLMDFLAPLLESPELPRSMEMFDRVLVEHDADVAHLSPGQMAPHVERLGLTLDAKDGA